MTDGSERNELVSSVFGGFVLLLESGAAQQCDRGSACYKRRFTLLRLYRALSRIQDGLSP